jgi:CheY-like chemotaxis protein
MNEKILLVDDNEDLLLITRIILKGQGYHTVLATSTDEAVKKIRIHNPSLMLLDICICNEDGRELCYQLKQNPETRDLRIILMSGNDCQQHDADDFLPKPFNYDELIQKVERQLATVMH